MTAPEEIGECRCQGGGKACEYKNGEPACQVALDRPPEAMTEKAHNVLAEALEHIKALAAFAYEQGFHELGYDPINVLETALRARESLATSAPEPRLTKIAQVGGTIFRPGIKVSTLVARAEREYEWQHEPEQVLARAQKMKNMPLIFDVASEQPNAAQERDEGNGDPGLTGGDVPAAAPDEVREWMLHMDLHLTEHDERHAGMALRSAWPHVRAYIAQLQLRSPQPAEQQKAIEECVAICKDADKSTHPADLADALRALIKEKP